MNCRGARGRPRSVAVWAHIHGGNHGDDLVVETVLDAMRQRGADDLRTISMYPPGTAARHGVDSFPIGAVPPGQNRLQWAERLPGPIARIRRLVMRAYGELHAMLGVVRLMRATDLLIIAGSGPLEDDPGCAYRLSKWVLLARLAGARVAILSVGAGPLENPNSQRLVKVALRSAQYVSVRDRSSAALLRSIGFDRGLRTMPDMGWAWPALTVRSGSPSGTPLGNRIGLNLMSLNDPRDERGNLHKRLGHFGIGLGEADWTRFNTYIAKLVEFTESMVLEGYEVLLFSTETVHDPVVRKEFLGELQSRGRCDLERVRLQLDTDPGGLLRTIRGCDVVVTTRFHAAVVSVASDRPTVGLAYHAKTLDLFERLGLSEMCLDAEDFAVEELIAAVNRAERVWSDHRAETQTRVDEMRQQIARQFDIVVSP
jgi:polysaccharide pyruvyl transferase WcaK-like protein